MTTAQTVAWIAALVLGVAGSALCSGAEVSFYVVNRVRLRLRAAPSSIHSASARILAQELAHPARWLATILILNTTFNNVAALALTNLLSHAGYSEGWLIVINAFVLTPVLLIFAETTPKEVFRVQADRLAYVAAPALRVARLLLTVIPLVPLVEWTAGVLARRAGGDKDAVSINSSREAIASLLKEGVGHGLLSESQSELFDRVLTLRQTLVRDEITPWRHVRIIREDWPRARALAFVNQHPFSRFPVVDAAGRVLGVVAQLDLALNPDTPIRELLAPPLMLAPETRVPDAIRALRAAGTSVAFVKGRAGVLGIVTMKDLVEPLTGELGAW